MQPINSEAARDLKHAIGRATIGARAVFQSSRASKRRGGPVRSASRRSGGRRRWTAAANRFGLFTPAWDPLNACRNWYPRTYPRFVEILRQLGASGLMSIPAEADAFGPAREDVGRYLHSAALDGPERLRLFRLALDPCLSAFAGRQSLYEYFFFGDPVRMAGALVATYDREPYKQRVRDFLVRD
jgi:4-hydroxyphenylacetate 3-monooxygenase